MSAKPTIVFDLDGTLADTICDLVAAMNRCVTRFDIAPIQVRQVAHLTGKGGLRAMISHAAKMSGKTLTESQLMEAFGLSVDDYHQNIAVKSQLYPGALAALKKFSSKGWRLGICTNKPIRQAEKLLSELGAGQLFHAITGVDSFDFKKPDPRHLTETIELAGGCSKRAVMVGDTVNDILTAQNAGIPVIAVDFGYSEKPVQAYQPDRVISGFEFLFDEALELIG